MQRRIFAVLCFALLGSALAFGAGGYGRDLHQDRRDLRHDRLDRRQDRRIFTMTGATFRETAAICGTTFATGTMATLAATGATFDTMSVI